MQSYTPPRPSSPKIIHREPKTSLTTPYSRYASGGEAAIVGNKLGWWERHDTTALSDWDDHLFEITPKYVAKAWLIAHEMYGRANLDWVILQFNAIVDPIEELVVGRKIWIPNNNKVSVGLTSLASGNRANLVIR